MKINITNHAKERVIKRINDVNTHREASQYLIDKFTRIRKGEKHKYWGKYTISKQEGNKFSLRNKTHHFIYSVLPGGIYQIITYYTKQSGLKEKKFLSKNRRNSEEKVFNSK